MYAIAYDSPLGVITLVSADGESLTGLRIEGLVLAGDAAVPMFDEDGAGESDAASASASVPDVLRRAADWLDRYFAGEPVDPAEIPLDPPGTEFRRMVWEYVAGVPHGEVVTYGEVAEEMARRLGKARMSARAVGGAVSHNPIPIFIPCHRVVAAQGLGGYGNCLSLKVDLLQVEGVDLSGIDTTVTGL